MQSSFTACLSELVANVRETLEPFARGQVTPDDLRRLSDAIEAVTTMRRLIDQARSHAENAARSLSDSIARTSLHGPLIDPFLGLELAVTETSDALTGFSAIFAEAETALRKVEASFSPREH
jgi:hypothetical protein